MKTQNKKSKRTPHSVIVLRQLMNSRNVLVKDFCDKLEITYPTSRVFLAEPKLLDGYQRKKLATLLKVKIETIDSIINESIYNIDGVFEAENRPTALKKKGMALAAD